MGVRLQTSALTPLLKPCAHPASLASELGGAGGGRLDGEGRSAAGAGANGQEGGADGADEVGATR